jgi:RNA polymerase sigma factor (sigma-70 family)
VLAYCIRRLDSRAEAEDAVQMTFLYAFRALQRGVVPESESAWLFAIAKNVCRWQRRTLSRRGSLSSDKDLDGFAGPEALDGDDAGLCRDLKEALRAIPASQRRALVLREWHGLPTSEVAARLELSTAATYALLTRARRSFMAAFTARREALPALQLGTLLYQLKFQLKAFFGTAAAKSAVAAVAVVAGGVGGVVVADELRSDPTAPPAAPVVAVDSADAATVSSVTTTSTSSSSRPPDIAPAGERAETRAATPGSATLPSTGDTPRQAPGPTGGPDRASDPTPTPSPTGTDVPTVPAPELPPAVPVDPPPLPGLELPEDFLPPVELPPLPPLPPLEPVEELPPLPPPPELPLPNPPVPDLPG